MSDQPTIIGANGLIATVNFNPSGPQNGFANISPGINPNNTGGSGPGPWTVTQLLPGADIQLTGSGEFVLPSPSRSPQLALGQGNEVFVGGVRGSMQVDVVVGTTAGTQGLAYLVGNDSPTTLFLGLSLAADVPTVTITNNLGTVVATLADPSPLAQGQRATIQVFWDSGNGVVVLVVNGQTVASTVVAPWASFIPIAVVYGSAVPSFGPVTAPFNGTFLKVQVSPNPGLAL